MEINSDLAGTKLKNYRTKISFRQTANFASGIDDDNPLYFDDRGRIPISHPMFVSSVTWPVLSRLEDFIESDSFPKEVLITQVHYSEHIIFHRLISSVDDLTISGQIKALLPHRAGTHAVIALNATDEKGLPVFTEYIGAMLRGVECGEGGKSGDLPNVPENKTGNGIQWQSDILIDPLRPYLYDGCSNIEFPIHTSPGFAEAVGLPGIILQGTATLSYAVSRIMEKEAQNDPERIMEIYCNFTGMVLPGSAISISLTGKEKKKNHTDIFFEVLNSEGKKAVRNGYIKLKG